MRVLTPEQYRQEAAARIMATVIKPMISGDQTAKDKVFNDVVNELRVAEFIGRLEAQRKKCQTCGDAYLRGRKDTFGSLTRCDVN